VEDYFLHHDLPMNNPVEGTHDGYRVDFNEAEHSDLHYFL